MSIRRRVSGCVVVLVAWLVGVGASAHAKDTPPRELTAEEDHRAMMRQLGIESLRPGANPNDSNAPNAVNYDEAKANPFPTLPDPLVTNGGKPVTTADIWWRERRPELVEFFDREIYGRVPKNAPSVRWEIVSTTRETKFGVPVVTKKLVGHVDNSAYPAITVDMDLTLTTPAKAKGPVPVMLEFGFVFPPEMARRFAAQAAASGAAMPNWQELLLKKGWGYAVLIPTSTQADNGAGLTKGVIGLTNRGELRKPEDWGALRAWAWGASRALDYFETDPAVDAKQVGIEGLSRYGKAALVAMAYDPRFAIGFIGSSGEGGVKLHRRVFGELVENLASTYAYHWMAGNFLQYAGPKNAGDLPIDAHELVALCAPRPVFVSYGAEEGPGAEGKWLDQRGSFMATVAAGPVYRLLGKKDLGTSEYPPLETALVDGELAFRQHRGGHTTAPNWPTFLSWADRYIHGPPVPPVQPAQPVQQSVGSAKVRADRANGVYRVGDKVRWTIEWTGGESVPEVSYRVKSGGYTEIAKGTLEFQDRVAHVETKFDEPNTMLLVVSWPEGDGKKHAFGGAVAAPEEIRAAAAEPDDFDAFWREKLAELAKVPANPQLEPAASGKEGVDFWKVTLGNIRGTKIRGQLARPAKGGGEGEKFPAILIVQYAGVYPLEKAWVTDRAAEGWLALDIMAHDLPIDEPAAFYEAQRDGPLKNYWAIGNDDPNTSYYLRMYLSCYRAVEYLRSRPDWNGKVLVVQGASQGGQQALVTGGLAPDGVTAVITFLPAACDMLAPKVGSAAGFPFWWTQTHGKDEAKVRSASRYYDPVNFAKRIRVPVYASLALFDDLAPPSSVYAALNNVSSPKEVLVLANAGHQNENGSQQAYYDRCYGAWLPALREGRAVEAPAAAASPGAATESWAARPAPQNTPAFLPAHETLLKKKSQGEIDVYFLGDSITRRWQGTDYPEHAKNWDANFRGWNAADFGWGGDTTQNVLWRLDQGELDGVNPQVIVLLIGTNNVGNKPTVDGEWLAADVATGVRAILDRIRAKAPAAKVVLMGITPRNDDGVDGKKVMPIIDAINARIAKFADGERVVYLNVNDKLADANGKLFDGVTEDGLHLSVEGYQVWADALAPLLSKWLGPRADVDKAPPATGPPKL
jgi:cephalosporin-C deacetylase-like acetyl esterase/lysophospholipase L1-like esterase